MIVYKGEPISERFPGGAVPMAAVPVVERLGCHVA